MIANKYINKRMVVVINRLCMRLTEGGLCTSSTNVRQEANLGFVEQVFINSVFGERIFPDIFHQAAAYMFFIIKNHIFMDGNKRTALACSVTFLQWNNIMLKPLDEHSSYDFVVEIAAGPNDPDTAVPKIAKWLEEQVLP